MVLFGFETSAIGKSAMESEIEFSVKTKKQKNINTLGNKFIVSHGSARFIN